MQNEILNYKNLEVYEGMVEDLIVQKGKINGVLCNNGKSFKSDSVVLTTGTFLNGIIFCGIVIRGETSHYDLVTQETFRAIGNLALEFPNIYMVNNVICVENKEQLIERLEKNTVNNSKALQEMFFNGRPSL